MPYNKGDPATDLKIWMLGGVIEFLEVSSGETPQTVLSSVRIIQSRVFQFMISLQWELVAGRQYEPILTTRDGLWRYRIGDVLLVKGFAPEDGMPIVNYVGRQE